MYLEEHMPTVLIADDSMFQRLMLAKIVKAQGLDVLEAKNGQECLDLMRAHAPVLTLLDLNMAVLSGLGVLEVVQRESIPVKVIVITADIQETTRQRCLDLGAQMVLSKPVKDSDVAAALRIALTGN